MLPPAVALAAWHRWPIDNRTDDTGEVSVPATACVKSHSETVHPSRESKRGGTDLFLCCKPGSSCEGCLKTFRELIDIEFFEQCAFVLENALATILLAIR